MTDSINGVNIPSLQNNKPVNFQQTVVTTPMQGIPVDQEKLKQAANDNYISNRVRASEGDNPLAKLGIGTAIWYALAQLMDRINPKMGGDFEKSIGGKVAGFGDRISKTWVGRKVDAFLDWFGTKSTKMAEKSQIVNSLKYHSTSPEWGFAKMPAKGLYGFWSMDAEQVLGDYLKPIGVNAQKLEQFGLTQTEINEFVKGLPVDNAERLLAIQKKELELLGAKPKAIESVYSKHGLEGLNKFAEGLKVKDMGIFKGPKEFKEFKFADNPEKTLKIFENLAEKRPNWKVSIWRNKTSVASNKFINTVGKITKAIFGEKAADKAVVALDKFSTHLFGRTISFTEYRNKALIASGKGGATRLGRFMSKSLGWLMEGGTNRFGGGKLVVAMQAFIFADMVMAVMKTPKNEKFKAAAERLVNDFSYFVGTTLGIIAMHKIGGFKYAGLKDTAAVEKYRKALKELNAKNDAALFANKKEFKAAVKELNAKFLGKENIKNPLTKLLQRLGSFINIGNERVHAYKSASKHNLNWLRKIKNGNLIGVPLRIWLVMGIAVPFIAKWATKGCHAIFGRPTHSVLDEDEEEKEKAEETAPASQQVSPTVQQTAVAQQVAQHKAPQDYQSDTNLIKQAMSGKPAFQGSLNSANDHPTVQDYKTYYPNTNYIKMTLNGQYPPEGGVAAQELNNGGNRYVPNPDSAFNQNSTVINNTTTTIVDGNGQTQAKPEPYRTYIPSPESKVKNNVDLTPAEKALADADNAEKFINDTLSKMQ